MWMETFCQTKLLVPKSSIVVFNTLPRAINIPIIPELICLNAISNTLQAMQITTEKQSGGFTTLYPSTAH